VRDLNNTSQCAAGKSVRHLPYLAQLFSGVCGLVLLASGLTLISAASVDAGFYDRFGSAGSDRSAERERVSCTSQNLDQLELKSIFLDIAKELCTDSCGDCGKPNQSCGPAEGKGPDLEQQRTVLVADFVDLQNFLPNQYGVVMGELMRGSLNISCCYRIVQAEFSKYFKLTESGLVVLSRNVNDIKTDKYNQPECIVGTYSFLNSKLIIFVRRINTTTGQITKMVMREIDFKCDQNKVTYTVK
jgi:hypothetical protein